MLEQASVFVHYLSPVENGELLLLDVRPTEEYESGYFPGAISIPI
ncbi:rhodanese-like domain-containing protein [Staphylococcus borealis]